MFAHLNTHTNFSLLSGADPVARILDTAAAQGCDALALTDTNGTYAAVPFYKGALERGLRPILGAEIKTAEGSVRLLAKTREGFGTLCRIVTARQLDGDFAIKSPSMLNLDGVVLMTWDFSILEYLAQSHGDTPPPDVYVEVPAWADWDEKHRAQTLIAWADAHRFPFVASNNVHFAEPGGHSTHRLLRSISEICAVDALAPEETAPPQAWLCAPEVMEEAFTEYPEAIFNSRRIADECRADIPLGGIRFPHFDLPPGESAFSYLWKVAFQGATERYRPLTPPVTRRLETELSVIGKMGFAPYFLVVWDIVQFAKKNGIPTVGRGSAADSIVSYCLGITHACPIEHDLYFERFLNPERKNPPDIDVDLCWRRRDEVLKYVYNKYGHDKVAMICTYNTFSARSALRDLAKSLGFTEAEVHRVARALPHYHNTKDMAGALERRPEAKDVLDEAKALSEIFAIAERIDGFPRHLSIHAGGIVIGDEPLTNLIPLQRSTNGLVITQYDMHAVEELGLLKIDLLGQRSLSVVADTERMVRDCYDPAFDVNRLPAKDPASHELLNKGATLGCFQLESPGMRALLQKLRMDDLETLIASISVIRPGPSDAGMMRHFIDRHNGTEAVEYAHPLLEPILKTTYGVMLYQEDILKVAASVAGMTLGEADVLRRAMTKLRLPDNMEQNHARFVSGAITNGVPADIAEELWRQVSGFSGYAFCKAHSVSYALISYQAAYLKSHYPAEFMAAVLANGGGFYTAHVYIEEARRMGIPILLPDVNRSGVMFQAEEGAIRVGLAQVRELTAATIESLLAARKRRAFTSLSDFFVRTEARYMELRTLIRVGAFDCFDLTRPELLWRLEIAFPKLLDARRTKQSSASSAATLFGDAPKVPSLEAIPRIPDYTLDERLRIEKDVLDFTVSAHPLALYRGEMAKQGPFVRAVELGRYIKQRVRVCGWIVTTKSTPTKKGDTMRFITIEDETGLIEATLFPKTYKQYGHCLHRPGPHVVEGRVEEDHTALTLTADVVITLVKGKEEGVKKREEVAAVSF